MSLSRRSRFFAAFVAVFSVLFMQLAVAAYACPMLGANAADGAHAGWTSTAGHEGMEGCETADDGKQPALCFAYSQEGKQSLNKPPLPDIPPAVVVAVVRTVVEAAPRFRIASPHAHLPWLMRLADPPLSIRNCCFRI